MSAYPLCFHQRRNINSFPFSHPSLHYVLAISDNGSPSSATTFSTFSGRSNETQTSDFQIPTFVENSKELLIPTNHHWFHLIHAVGVLAYKAIIPLNLISLPLYKTSKKIFLYFHVDNNYICSCVPSNI